MPRFKHHSKIKAEQKKGKKKEVKNYKIAPPVKNKEKLEQIKRPKFKAVDQRVLKEVIPRKLVKARQHKILMMYASGKTPEQIASQLDMKTNHVKMNINSAVDELVQHYSTPSPQATFVRYAAFQFNVIMKLDNIVEAFADDIESKSHTAAVSALRAQSDIYDKIMDQGRHFGVIQQAKASDAIRQAPKNIRLEIRKEITVLNNLLNELDESKEVRSLRQSGVQTQQKTTVKIKMPLRNSKGIIRAIGDFREKKSNSGAKEVDLDKVIESELSSENETNEDRLLQAYNEEIGEDISPDQVIDVTPKTETTNWLVPPKTNQQ